MRNCSLATRHPGCASPDPINKRDKRSPFDRDQLHAIFNAPLYRGCVDGERGYNAGFYVQGSGAWLGNITFDRIGRASAYGQAANGKTEGDGWAASGEAGWRIGMRGFSITPFAAVDYTDLKLDGYAETGASVSNVVFADRSFRQLTASFGGELGVQMGAIRPAIRGGYSIEREYGDRSAAVRLAGVQHSMGSTVLTLANTERDVAFGELRIAMRRGPLSGYVSGRGCWGRGDDDARAPIGASFAF